MVILTFFAVLSILSALTYAFFPGEMGIASRLSRMLNEAGPVRESGFKEKQKKRLKDALVSVGKLVSANPASSQSQLMLLRAGFRRPEARLVIAGVRILLPVILVAAAYFGGRYLVSAAWSRSPASSACGASRWPGSAGGLRRSWIRPGSIVASCFPGA